MRLPTMLVAAILSVGGLAPAHADDAAPAKAAQRPAVTVYKTPWCGCCGSWADHMRANGYAVMTHDMSDLDFVKKGAGVHESLQSCHTAIVDGYVIAGHVPAVAVDKLLRERPDVRGLAVPGMPIGSPGMEGPDPEAYDVLSFDKAGTPKVFMHIPAGGR